ncbi:MAG: hypothetical protein ACKV0T_00460 [Planctomycetales bacterium]
MAAALADCGAVDDGQPAVLGCRLPMETDYRDFWEFPYSESLKSGLLATFIQARAVLAWFRHLEATGVRAEDVTIVPRSDAGTAIETIGGVCGSAVVGKAREVERAVYQVVGSLVPPKEESLAKDVTGTYRPFDAIEKFSIRSLMAGSNSGHDLVPLVILDDAHCLHPAQFRAVGHWLARRELRIARWVITRFDILQPAEALAAVAEERSERKDFPGLSASRDVEVVMLQSNGPRKAQRIAFRRMARDMAGRYLQKHPLLGPRQLVILGDLLEEEPATIAPSEVRLLSGRVDAAQRKLKVADNRRREFEEGIESFRRGGEVIPEDLGLAMLGILMHRYAKRRKDQGTLFENDDPEPSRPVVANAGVYEAARLHLLHHFDRPFYYGIDALCDASSENAELFLQLSAVLVDTLETQVIRSKRSTLTAAVQHRLLREHAARIIDTWSFPCVEQVRRMVKALAAKCVAVTLQPNGWLTPNAFGIPQAEYDQLGSNNPEVARVLQFAVAYNALLVVPHYECKQKEWCLLELAGPVNLAHGLTLMRGGFIEGRVRDIAAMIEEPPA